MPTIAVANTKGGSGKTTASLLLGGSILDAGGRTVFLEGDPNRPLAGWATRRGERAVFVGEGAAAPADAAAALSLLESAAGPDGKCAVVSHESPDVLMIWLEAAQSWGPTTFVICDPEGSRNDWMTTAISQADLVIIPFAPTALDADQVSETIKLLNRTAKLLRREVVFRTLLTRKPGVNTKDERAIRSDLLGDGVPIFTTELYDRAAYRALFAQDALLGELTEQDVSQLVKARAEAGAFANEVMEVIRATRRKEVA